MAFKGSGRESRSQTSAADLPAEEDRHPDLHSQEGFITLIFEDGYIIGITFPKKLEMRVGNVFVKQEIISEEMLQRALAIQKRTNQKVGEILIRHGADRREDHPRRAQDPGHPDRCCPVSTEERASTTFKVLDYVGQELGCSAPSPSTT